MQNVVVHIGRDTARPLTATVVFAGLDRSEASSFVTMVTVVGRWWAVGQHEVVVITG